MIWLRRTVVVVAIFNCAFTESDLRAQTVEIPTLTNPTYTSSATLSDIPVILCLPNNASWESVDVSMLNSGASASYDYGSGWYVCENPTVLLVDLSLVSGENTLQVQACLAPTEPPILGDPCATQSVTIFFAPGRAATVRGLVDAGGVRLLPDSSTTVTFTVKNTGNFQTPFDISPACTGGIVRCLRTSTGDSLWTTSVLAVGDSVQYTLDVRASPATFNSGSAGLRARPVNASNAAVGHTFVAVSLDARAAPLVAKTRDTVRVATSAAGGQATFVVTNPDPVSPRLVAFSATCGTLSSCVVSPSAATWIQPTESIDATVTFSAPGSSQTTRIVLTASATGPTQSAKDSVAVRVGTVPTATVTLSAANPNPGSSISRSHCLSAPIASGLGLECGGLVASHATPAVRTMNVARAAMLTYRSRQAEPRAEIAAVFSYTGSAVPPDSVRAQLQVSGPAAASLSRAWPWSPSCATAAGCRLVFPIDAVSASLTTGAYGYRLIVRSAASTSSPQDTLDGHFAIVDDRASPFGAGWWLAGLERLVQNDSPGNQLLWVGGDGSTRLYVRQGSSNVFLVQQPVDRPDTLEKVGATFVRRLPGGATVTFDSLKRHTQTRNAVGHLTRFHYGSGSLLDSIGLPTPGDTTRSIRFKWVGTQARLDSISVIEQTTGAPRRATGFAHDSLRRIVTIRDPDTTFVYFRYSGTTARLNARINRLSDTTDIEYDPIAMVKRVSIRMRGAAPLVSQFCHLESQSLVAACRDTLSVAPIALHRAFSLVDGPRSDVPDVSRLYLGRFGAPDSVVDAHGSKSSTRREDSRWPALATEVKDALGQRTRVVYNARALADSVLSIAPYGGGDAVMTYTWHSKWPAAT